MNSKRISAALVITVALVALIGLGGAQFIARGDEYNPHRQLVGSWEVTVMAPGQDPVIDFATFTEGGGLIGTDPDPNVSTGIGTWERIGPDRFAVTFVHFLSDQGAPLGTLKVRAEATLDSQTDTFSGPFRTDVVIGGNVVQSICGTVQARRVDVEALQACP
jgi:hypothetical protein